MKADKLAFADGTSDLTCNVCSALSLFSHCKHAGCSCQFFTLDYLKLESLEPSFMIASSISVLCMWSPATFEQVKSLPRKFTNSIQYMKIFTNDFLKFGKSTNSALQLLVGGHRFDFLQRFPLKHLTTHFGNYQQFDSVVPSMCDLQYFCSCLHVSEDWVRRFSKLCINRPNTRLSFSLIMSDILMSVYSTLLYRHFARTAQRLCSIKVFAHAILLSVHR